MTELVIKEYYDVEALDTLLTVGDFDSLSKEKNKDGKTITGAHIEANLKKIKKELINNSYLEKTYVQKKGIGRWYYKEGTGCGMLYLPNSVRGFITQEGTKDLDMVNCHPTLLNYIMKEFNILCPELQECIDNREKFLAECGIDKRELIIIINSKDCKSKNQKIVKIHDTIYKTLILALKDSEPAIWKSNHKKENKEGSFISRVLQNFEQQVLLDVIGYFKAHNVSYGTFIYDGIHVYDNLDLKDLNRYLKKMWSKEFKFALKAFDTTKVKQLLKINEENYEDFKKMTWEKDHFYIQSEEMIACTVLREIKKFKPRMCEFDIYLTDPELTPYYKKNFINRWIYGEPKKRCYYGLDCYPPPNVCPKDMYNTWKEFERSKNEKIDTSETLEGRSPDIQESVIKTFTDFVKFLSESNNDFSTYLINFIAHMIQKPGEKPGVCIVFSSEQGLGKGTLINLIENLIGSEKTLKTEDSNTVLGRFTGCLSGKILVNINESKCLEMFDGNSMLKALITDPTHKIEYKGKDAITENSYLRIIITTNDETPCKVEASDRRMVIFNQKSKNQELVNQVLKLGDNEVQMIFQYLKSYEIKYKNMFEWQSNRPKSKMYIETKSSSFDVYHQFIFKLLKDKDKETFEISNQNLIKLFERFTYLIGKKDYKIDCRLLAKKLLDIDGISITNSNSIRGKSFDRKKIDNYLAKKGYNDYQDSTGISLFEKVNYLED